LSYSSHRKSYKFPQENLIRILTHSVCFRSRWRPPCNILGRYSLAPLWTNVRLVFTTSTHFVSNASPWIKNPWQPYAFLVNTIKENLDHQRPRMFRPCASLSLDSLALGRVNASSLNLRDSNLSSSGAVGSISRKSNFART